MSKNQLIRFYSDESQVLLVDTIINYKMARWISPDPAYQHNSPYLGMSNNPISRIDPDGALDLGPFGYFNNFNDYYIHFAGLNFRNLGTGGGAQFWSEGLNIGNTEKVVRNVKYNHLQNMVLIPTTRIIINTFYDEINRVQYDWTDFQRVINLQANGASKYKNFNHIQGVQFTVSNQVNILNEQSKAIFSSSSERRTTNMLSNKNYSFDASVQLNPIRRQIPMLDGDINANNGIGQASVIFAVGRRCSAVHRIRATPKFFEQLEKSGVATVE